MARRHIDVPQFPPLTDDTSTAAWVSENLEKLTALNTEGLSWRAIASALRAQGIAISDGTLSGTITLLRKGVVTAQNRKLRTPAETAADNIDLEKLIGELKMENVGQATQKYASDIWKTADILRGAGIKESEWPSYMMPFLALMLIESRIIRTINEELSDGDLDIEDLKEAIRDANCGYHEGIVQSKGKSHRLTDKVTSSTDFEEKLKEWLDDFDSETRELLGHIPSSKGHGEDFLGISTVIGKLAAKDSNPLHPYVSAWAEIDLTGFNNSEITTLEEHIKRKWADISAETAGEQYTPNDIIQLVAELITDRVRESGQDNISVYDMTCGGGNFLFGVEDTLSDEFNHENSNQTVSIRTNGQEINSSLYALAKIESRFRPRSDIRMGNTLINDRFSGRNFNYIVANPPYGVDWKMVENAIKADASARFPTDCRPPTSDGQMLFMQHAFSHLEDDGMAFIVHSGSTLFSGDAGGGESEWRRTLIQKHDAVEAIIQLPKNEFFNTGISTYLWILNKNKTKDRKGKILMINAETLFTKLKKNLNQKNCELAPANREVIREIFKRFETSPYAKVLSCDEVLYNKVEIEITRLDENGLGYGESISLSDKVSFIQISGRNWHKSETGFWATDDEGRRNNGKALTPKEREELFKQHLKDQSGITLLKKSDGSLFLFDVTDNTISEGVAVENAATKGKGTLVIKAKVGKNKGLEGLKLDISLCPLVEKDIETIPFNSDEEKNKEDIAAFLSKWVKEPCSIRGSKVGCEINFNRLFPKKTEIRTVAEINKDIAALNAEIAELEAEFNKSLGV